MTSYTSLTTMMSFNSFSSIVANEPNIEEILQQPEHYHAHTHSTAPFEKLHEHVHLVMHYAEQLVVAHGLDSVVDSMINELISSYSKVDSVEVVGNIIKRHFVNALVYHDYGKVNENFQIEKMKDKTFFKRNETNKIGSQHSILSAYIYLYTHLDEITSDSDLTDNERLLLAVSTFLFSDSIIKHHSSYIGHVEGIDSIKREALSQYLKLFNQSISKEVEVYLNNTNQILKVFQKKKFRTESGRSYFPLFALVKLNFSLLTASDYYATNHFMGNMPLDDFGVLKRNDIDKLIDLFTDNKNAIYNRHIINNSIYYSSIPIQSLMEVNNHNLNQLRKKMAAEAVLKLRQNLHENLFYLEAPTGSGKTNISFASVIELLKSDSNLNKVFYVFPFTTLITQTFESIKKTLQLENNQVIQLHSKAGFHTSSDERQKDGLYGDEKLNYINNLFINYPFTLLSHIKFFDILKSNNKDSNYILHRLSNSIIIIDELQTYSPDHWDKVILFLYEYSKHFNIKVIMMSATLPKIDTLSNEAKDKVVRLITNKDSYFTNPNFKGRVEFNFDLLGKNGKDYIELDTLLDKLYLELEKYASKNGESANGLVEFIVKKSASKFYQLVCSDPRFSEYTIFIISGTILEPRRKEIIEAIKTKKYRGKQFKKSIVVTTQVIEAGVDIDMDIGFKDRSLVDSDEQLAGRINRNASKKHCKVFMFNYDKEVKIYGKDKRYEQKISITEYKKILHDKNFDILYDKVNNSINSLNKSTLRINIEDYLNFFTQFDYRKINEEFKLIDSNTTSVFVPLNIDAKWFDFEEITFLQQFEDTVVNDKVIGEVVFQVYQAMTESQLDFIQTAIKKKQIGGVMSKFMFSIYSNSFLEAELSAYANYEVYERYGFWKLDHWDRDEMYSLEAGINDEKFKSNLFI